MALMILAICTKHPKVRENKNSINLNLREHQPVLTLFQSLIQSFMLIYHLIHTTTFELDTIIIISIS